MTNRSAYLCTVRMYSNGKAAYAKGTLTPLLKGRLRACVYSTCKCVDAKLLWRAFLPASISLFLFWRDLHSSTKHTKHHHQHMRTHVCTESRESFECVLWKRGSMREGHVGVWKNRVVVCKTDTYDLMFCVSVPYMPVSYPLPALGMLLQWDSLTHVRLFSALSHSSLETLLAKWRRPKSFPFFFSFPPPSFLFCKYCVPYSE